MCTEELTPEPQAAAPARRTRRSKLWELSRRYHCSLIGTCSTLEELRQLVARCNIVTTTAPGDYEIHGVFVNLAAGACLATRQLNKLLDRKYAREIRSFMKIRDAGELALLWQEHLDGGQVGGAYWALMTHPCLTAELAGRAHEQMHMLSHQAAADHSAQRKRTALLEQRCGELGRQLAMLTERSARQLRERDQKLRRLNARLIAAMDAERQLEFAGHRIRRLENNDDMQRMRRTIRELNDAMDAAQRQAARATSQAEDLSTRLLALHDENDALRAELRSHREDSDALESEMRRWLATESAAPGCPADCGSLDLCGRCVLYVGGRSSQCAHFRQLVERCNGRFIHHDGGREDAALRLGTIMNRADAILCPVDCVSHDAYNRVKRFAEQHAKRLVLMPRASLAAFARGLRQVSDTDRGTVSGCGMR